MTTMQVKRIPMASISLDTDNPRPKDIDIEGLANSMQMVGLLAPIQIRANGKGYMVVAGTRRYLAAKHLKWEMIPAVITDYNHEYVRFVENEQRAPIHPIEQGLRVTKMLEDKSVSEVAKELGETPHRIAFLADLATFEPKVLKLFREERLSVDHMRLLVEVRDPAIRLSYAEKWAVSEWNGVVPLSRCKEELKKDTLRLKEAKWDLTDATMPGGACTACPKNTQQEGGFLFIEMTDVARCTDFRCWQDNLTSHMALLKAALDEKSRKVMTEEHANKHVHPHGGLRQASEYIDLKRPLSDLHRDSKSKKKLKGLVDKQVEIVYIPDPYNGVFIQAGLRASVQKALLKSKVAKASDIPIDRSIDMLARKDEEKKQAAAMVQVRRASTSFITLVPDMVGETPDLMILKRCIQMFPHDAMTRVCKVRGIDTKTRFDFENVMLEQAVDLGQATVILTQLVISSMHPSLMQGPKHPVFIHDLAKLFKFDLKAAGKQKE